MLTTLKNETTTVTISSLGAEMQSFVSGGIDYLWNGDPAYWSGRAPHLFPIVGGLRNGKATSDGGDITCQKHGFVRKSELTLVEATDESATYALYANDDTRAVYPYDFAFFVKYQLAGTTLNITYEVHNVGDKPLPFCIGGHPGFRVPLTAEDCFEDYCIELEQKETLDCPQVDMSAALINDRIRNRVLTDNNKLTLNHVMFRGDALIFDRLQSRIIRLYSQKTGHGVDMNFESFPFVAVWTPVEDSPFVCLEPWNGMATCVTEDDVFEHKIGAEVLPTGEKSVYHFSLSVY